MTNKKICNFCGKEYESSLEHFPCQSYIECVKERRKQRSKAGYVPASLRKLILERDKKCVMCRSTENLQIDHIKRVSDGGISEEKNLRVLCQSCNLWREKIWRQHASIDDYYNRIGIFLKRNQWPDEHIKTLMGTLKSKGLQILSVLPEKEKVTVKFPGTKVFFIFQKDGSVQVCRAKR